MRKKKVSLVIVTIMMCFILPILMPVKGGQTGVTPVITGASTFTDYYETNNVPGMPSDDWLFRVGCVIETPDGEPFEDLTVTGSPVGRPDIVVDLTHRSGGYFLNEPVPWEGFYENLVMDEGEGLWIVTATDSDGDSATRYTNLLDKPVQMPVVENIQFSYSGVNPIVSWDPTTFFVNGAELDPYYRVRFYDMDGNFIHWSDYLTTPWYEIPSGVLDFTESFYVHVETLHLEFGFENRGNAFQLITLGYPTVDGQPLFTLHICVAQESQIADGVGEAISDSLHDIGIEGVVHNLPWWPIYNALYPENTGASQYGVVRPSRPGEPELVSYTLPRDVHFHQTDYLGQGVMWCGTENSDLLYPPGYGNNWDESIWKWFELPDGSPQLSYSIQFDLEEDFDNVFVEVSTNGVDWDIIGSHTSVSSDFEHHSIDMSDYAHQIVQVRFHVITDVSWSDEDHYDSNGACRIDWVEVTSFARDEFESGTDGWTATAEPFEITVMEGYDIGFHGLNFYEAYRCWEGFEYAHSGSTYNQGYLNSHYDSLYGELETLSINWNAEYPDPPDLSSPDGVLALEKLDELQMIWNEDQPSLILHNRIMWGTGDTGFSIAPWNHRNENLEIPEVRRAINLAMNRQAILDVYNYDPAMETYLVDTWIPPWWNQAFNSVSYAEYDIMAARQLLYDAGYTRINDLGGLSDVVDAYVTDGVLTEGVGTSLTRKLEMAAAMIEQGNYIPASKQLDSFIKEVEALVRAGELSQEEGQRLINLAEEIKNQIP
jgi:hypothetical protein